MMKKISIIYEGGGGDTLLFHRFLPAIREYYGDCEFYGFLNSNGNKFQQELLSYLFPSSHKQLFTITHKKYKEFVISSQWGEEKNMIGYKENIPQEWMDKINSYDVVINGHLDSLDFIDQSWNWKKFFYTFPKPEISPTNHIGPYIISHLISSTSNSHRLEDWYITKLIKDVDKLCEELNWQHIIISQESFNKYYDEGMRDCKKSHILNGSITDVCDMIINAKMMISVDSGFRPIAYPLMPVISFSKQCSAPNQMQPSHVLRWNPIKPYFPLNWNTNDIIKTAKKLLENKTYSIFPELCLTDYKLSDILIKRDYKVSDKSIL